MKNKKRENLIKLLLYALGILMILFDGWNFMYIWNSLINHNSILFDINYINSLGFVIILCYINIIYMENTDSEGNNENIIDYFKSKYNKYIEEFHKRIVVVFLVFLINLFI